MKKLLAVVAVLVGLTAAKDVYAVERSGRAAENSIITTGDTLSFYKASVSTTSAIVISTGTASRALVTCRNASNLTVYLGAASNITAAGAGTWEMGESTSTAHTFSTNNIATIYAIGRAQSEINTAIGLTVYCVEER